MINTNSCSFFTAISANKYVQHLNFQIIFDAMEVFFKDNFAVNFNG